MLCVAKLGLLALEKSARLRVVEAVAQDGVAQVLEVDAVANDGRVDSNLVRVGPVVIGNAAPAIDVGALVLRDFGRGPAELAPTELQTSLMIEILGDNASPQAGEVYGALGMDWSILVGQVRESAAA